MGDILSYLFLPFRYHISNTNGLKKEILIYISLIIDNENNIESIGSQQFDNHFNYYLHLLICYIISEFKFR